MAAAGAFRGVCKVECRAAYIVASLGVCLAQCGVVCRVGGVWADLLVLVSLLVVVAPGLLLVGSGSGRHGRCNPPSKGPHYE